MQVAMGDAFSQLHSLGRKVYKAQAGWTGRPARREASSAHSRADGVEARSMTARSSANYQNFSTFVLYLIGNNEGWRSPCSGSPAGLRVFSTSGM